MVLHSENAFGGISIVSTKASTRISGVRGVQWPVLLSPRASIAPEA